MGPTGTAVLPLHWGRVPPWLSARMAALGRVITEAVILHYGRDEFLRRLAHPHWFQAFGAVMGMDWHSSGIPTSVIGAPKRGLKPLESELGLHVCGGRGKHSRQTPQELVAIGDDVGFDGAALARASRLVAKVDSAAVQDGFDLYLHGFIVADDGHWVVVQQGMNGDQKLARRYHWISEGLKNFIDEPHAAIEGVQQGVIVNLTDHRAEASRQGQLDLLSNWGPDKILREFAKLQPGATAPAQAMLPHLVMPPITMSVRAISTCVGCMAISPLPPIVALRTSRSSFSRPVSVLEPSRRLLSWPRSCTGRPAGFRIRRASHWPMAARTGIPTLFP
jgi:uncharacterized protein